jgi:hypothetical protein
MDKARRRSPFSRYTVLAIVVGGHVLLVMMFANSRPGGMRAASSSSEVADAMVLLNLAQEPQPTEIPEELSPEPITASIGAIDGRAGSASEDSAAIPEPDVGSPGSASVEAPGAESEIDWEREAKRTAETMAPGLIRKQLRECEEAKKHNKYPPGCKKPASAYEPHWEPERKRAGFAPLPYVLIGKRCIVGLGFFGCTLGKLPDADGSVFENMYDTERPRSSVPEVPASVWPERPAPQALKEQ